MVERRRNANISIFSSHLRFPARSALRASSPLPSTWRSTRHRTRRIGQWRGRWTTSFFFRGRKRDAAVPKFFYGSVSEKHSLSVSFFFSLVLPSAFLVSLLMRGIQAALSLRRRERKRERSTERDVRAIAKKKLLSKKKRKGRRRVKKTRTTNKIDSFVCCEQTLSLPPSLPPRVRERGGILDSLSAALSAPAAEMGVKW